MSNLAKMFGRSVFDSALENFKKFSNELNDSINAFQFDDIDKAFSNARKNFNESFNTLKKRVSKTKDNVIINIPYDRNTDTIETSIKDNYFTAVVKNEEGTNEVSTSVYLDDDVDVDSVSRRYDAEKKLMYFTFVKKC